MKHACLGYQGGVCAWPRGRALGGTSVINYLIYTRGNRRDFDNWEKLGNTGWSYRDVLPYFKKSENVKIPSLRTSPYHGTSGPVDNDHASYISPLFTSFIEAGKNMGYRHNDPNGASQLGFSLAQATLRNGKRVSAAKAYLRPVADRPNLHISMNSWVTKILIDPHSKVAYGVEFVKNRKKYQIRAKKEVILSAGSIASPQLLLLSGVGPRAHLEDMDIPVIQDLKVGYNLQDHPQLSGLTFTVDKPVTLLERDFRDPLIPLDYFLRGKGPLTVPGGAEGIAFIKTNTSFNREY
jgi:choline dehydrogenase-like flavoprotein